MTTQTANEIAREVAACAAKASKRLNLQDIANEILAGLRDEGLAVQSALAMHARLTGEHQAAVAELVEGLGAITNYATQCEADVAGDRYFDESDEVKAARALIAKHRAPDAFDTWAEDEAERRH